MAVRQAEVRCIAQHWDKGARATIKRGTTFVLPLDSAQRRVRAGLVEIIREFAESDGPDEIKAFDNKAEITMGASATVEKRDEPVVVDVEIEGMPEIEVTLELEPDADPESLLTKRGKSTWYDVEGYDSNPVQGRDKALEIAKGLLDT